MLIMWAGVFSCASASSSQDREDRSYSSNLARSLPPYEKLYIYVNKYNPTSLDLHGVSSVRQAKSKFIEFIHAAKAKHKENLTVITGRGNHINRGGNRGTLFQSLSSWAEEVRSIRGAIESYQPLNRDGAYILFLRPTDKKNQNSYLRHKQEVYKKKILWEGRSIEEREKFKEHKLQNHKNKKKLEYRVNALWKGCNLEERRLQKENFQKQNNKKGKRGNLEEKGLQKENFQNQNNHQNNKIIICKAADIASLKKPEVSRTKTKTRGKNLVLGDFLPML